MRRGLRRLPSSAGYVVETFANATELLARDPLSVPGCLILDVHLPDLSGLDLHALLRSTGVDKATVFVTGHDDVPASVRAMRGVTRQTENTGLAGERRVVQESLF